MPKPVKPDRRWEWFEDDEEIRLLENGKRGILAVVFGRFTIIALLVLLEFALIILAAHYLGEYSSAFYLLSRLLSVGVIFYLINTSGTPTTKITWIVLIFAVPALGLTLYLIVRLDFGHRAIKSRLQTIIADTAPLCPLNLELMDRLRTDEPGLRGLAAYAYRTASGMVYENNAVRYLPSGEAKFEALLEELRGLGLVLRRELRDLPPNLLRGLLVRGGNLLGVCGLLLVGVLVDVVRHSVHLRKRA